LMKRVFLLIERVFPSKGACAASPRPRRRPPPGPSAPGSPRWPVGRAEAVCARRSRVRAPDGARAGVRDRWRAARHWACGAEPLGRRRQRRGRQRDRAAARGKAKAVAADCFHRVRCLRRLRRGTSCCARETASRATTKTTRASTCARCAPNARAAGVQESAAPGVRAREHARRAQGYYEEQQEREAERAKKRDAGNRPRLWGLGVEGGRGAHGTRARPPACRAGLGAGLGSRTRLVRSVRGEGRGVSSQYGRGARASDGARRAQRNGRGGSTRRRKSRSRATRWCRPRWRSRQRSRSAGWGAWPCQRAAPSIQ